MLFLIELLKKYFLTFLGLEDLLENELDDNNKEEKKINKKIIYYLIIILIILISIFYYKISFNTDSIEYLLNELKNYIDEDTFVKIQKIINKILECPEEKQTGIYLLEIIKICKKINSKSVILNYDKFNFYLDKIIKELSK
jgi:hypothetical protein